MSKEERILLYEYLIEVNALHDFLKNRKLETMKSYKNGEINKKDFDGFMCFVEGGIQALILALGILDNCIDKHLGVNRGELH